MQQNEMALVMTQTTSREEDVHIFILFLFQSLNISSAVNFNSEIRKYEMFELSKTMTVLVLYTGLVIT